MRPRCLICAYDSTPILERLLPLLKQLEAHYEPIVFVQFPGTQRELENLGYETFLYRSVIGWEHGNLKALKPLRSPSQHRSYESTLYGDNYDWSGFERKLRNRIASVFQALSPGLLIVWNGFTLPVTEFIKVAHHYSLPVRYLERGLFPGTLFIDPMGTNAASSIAQKTEFDLTLEALGHEICATFKTHYQPIVQSPITEDSRPEWRSNTKRAVFIEQLDHDTNIVLFSSDYPTNGKALQAFERELKGDDWSILIKEHPEASGSRDLRVNSSTAVTTQAQLVDLIRGTDLVLTRNSTVGFEALVFGKDVRCLGAALYSYFDAQSPHLVDKEEPEREQVFHRFVGELFHRHHITTNPEIAKDYPRSGGYEAFLQPSPNPTSSHLGDPRAPYWRWPAVKSIQRMEWGGRLLLRQLKQRGQRRDD